MADITPGPLDTEDREQFISDNQEAFNYWALEEFGRRNDHFEEEDEIISRRKLNSRISICRGIFRMHIPGGVYLTERAENVGHKFHKLIY